MPVGLHQPGALAGRIEGIQVMLALADHHVHAVQLAELAQFLGGELGLGRTAAADHVHLANLARLERLEHRLGDIGLTQLGGVLDQDAGDVHRYVADADHRH